MNPFSLPKTMNLHMGGMDPCSMGPLTCGVHPQDMMGYREGSYEEEEDNAEENEGGLQHLFAVAAQKGRASLQSAFRSHQTQSQPSQPSSQHHDDLVEITKTRILDFQNRGWLSQQETRKYMAILDAAPIQKGNKQHFEEYIRTEMMKELDSLEDRMTTNIPASASSVSSSSSSRVMNKPVARPLGDVTTNQLNSRRTNKSEVIVSDKELAKQIGDDQIEEVFVETCFFARLGFVQPPSCLKCAYRESIKGDTTTAKCNRWVAWRRDANHIIHPSYLMENTIFVQCHAARQLLEG